MYMFSSHDLLLQGLMRLSHSRPVKPLTQSHLNAVPARDTQLPLPLHVTPTHKYTVNNLST